MNRIQFAKRKLEQWASCDEKIRLVNMEIEDYQAQLKDARELNAINMDGMPHGNTVSNPTEQKALTVLKIEETYLGTISYLADEAQKAQKIRAEIDGLLDELPPLYREICTARYKRRLAWLDVADECCISEAYAKELHGNIIDVINMSFK